MRAIRASAVAAVVLNEAATSVGLRDLALPAIDRVDCADDIDAGGEAFLDDGPTDRPGLFLIRE